MKTSLLHQSRGGVKPRRREWARVHPLLLVGGCGLLLAASSGWWLATWPARTSQTPAARSLAPASVPRNSDVSLAPGTVALLSRLDSVVQIRYCAILDPGPVDDGLRSFATQVGQWLSAYERSGQGRVEVIRHESRTPASVAAASEDGLTPFHLDKGEPCYFGLAVAFRGNKEVLPRLNPEWAQAFEPDLTRAIERLMREAQPVKEALAMSTDPDTATIASVRRLVPEFATLSLEEGTRILRETSLRQLESAVQSTDAQIKEIETRLVEAQARQSATEQQSAIQELQRVQAAQSAKLKEISARSLAEIEALRRLKNSGR